MFSPSCSHCSVTNFTVHERERARLLLSDTEQIWGGLANDVPSHSGSKHDWLVEEMGLRESDDCQREN